MGKVSFGGIVKEICLAYTPEAAVGELRAGPRRLRHQPASTSNRPRKSSRYLAEIGEADEAARRKYRIETRHG